MGYASLPTTGHDERIFEFFELPRELRDLIYALLTEDRQLSDGKDPMDPAKPIGFHIMVSGMIPKLTTLNHQFSAEYEQAYKSVPTKTYKDIGAPIRPPKIPRKSTKAKIVLLVVCRSKNCDGSGNWCVLLDQLYDHVRWIKLSIEAGLLGEVDVKLYPSRHHTSDDLAHSRDIMGVFHKLTEFGALSSIQLFPCRLLSDEEVKSKAAAGVKAYEISNAPEKVWTKKGGWQRMSW